MTGAVSRDFWTCGSFAGFSKCRLRGRRSAHSTDIDDDLRALDSISRLDPTLLRPRLAGV